MPLTRNRPSKGCTETFLSWVVGPIVKPLRKKEVFLTPVSGPSLFLVFLSRHFFQGVATCFRATAPKSCWVPMGSVCIADPAEVPHPGDQWKIEFSSGSARQTNSWLQEEKGPFYNPLAQNTVTKTGHPFCNLSAYMGCLLKFICLEGASVSPACFLAICINGCYYNSHGGPYSQDLAWFCGPQMTSTWEHKNPLRACFPKPEVFSFK